MPKVTTKRDDILRPSEITDMLESAKYEPWLQCLVCILAVFGKRISEVIKLKRSDIWFDDTYLFVQFNVLKKASKKADSMPKPYLKRKTRKHAFVKPIIRYIIGVEKGYLFPSTRSAYGYISRQHAWNKIKALNPKAWCHLFRESLATSMAEHDATEEDLLHWFDWDRVDTAHRYVKRGTRLTKKWSDRAY
ncbi:MAG: site-specific integrase [Gammaproteobacteria bacterium]|nr:site-specific integrase [Gammaproteobacteria bacterium]